jgi:Zn-finger protein
MPCCFTTTVAATPYCMCLDAEEAACTEYIETATGTRVTTCPPP